MRDHSSEEESDDSECSQMQPTVTTPRNNESKRRMKTLSPQDSINRTWGEFFSCYSGKPLVVLPSGCVSLGAADHGQSNELLSDAYERTAEECRRIVEHHAEECRRVNMRYEDNDWNLDRDLKQKKGHCLNGLGSQRFKFDKDTLLSPSALTPKSVKRVHEIFEKPTFMQNVNGGDIQQGNLANCWLIGAMTALGNDPDAVMRTCVAYDTKVGIYGFVFYRDGEWIQAIIDDKLYLKSADWNSPNTQRLLLGQIGHGGNEDLYRKTCQTGSKALFFARCRDQNETWVPLMEKAYAKAHGDYASLSDGWMSEALEDLSGNVFTGLQMSNILRMDELWDKMSSTNNEFLFGASADYLGRSPIRPDGILEAHSYVVMDSRKLKSGERLVKLRDPRGKVDEGTWRGPWGDGSKEWTSQTLEELGHIFGSDSVFWMSCEDFPKIFTHLDCMRRFRGDWRCCQRWIAVDVPWVEEYQKKFHFKLTKNSPLCLVLSQLDRRYYAGLWGQYSFHLDFRLHKEDSPDAEDYVARPHGHYVTARSVSVDLAELSAGNYVVHLKVTCERDVSACSVTEVVRYECRNRVENQKLAQVGRSYDLAHSKARSYIDKRIKLRQEMEKRIAKAEAKVSEAVEAEGESEGESEGEAFNGAETKPSAAKNVLDFTQDSRDPENLKAETIGAVPILPGSPHLTPESVESVDGAAGNKQEVHPIDGATPDPLKEQESLPVRARPAFNYADESSDSPAEDWGVVKKANERVSKPHDNLGKQAAVQSDDETEEEGAPDPWNAVCVVGIRVYSKDPGLELQTMMEGDELI